MKELIVRFLLGGAGVSFFAAVAELFKPKTFSGILGAAPAVALVSLALTYLQRGDLVVRDRALGMICGGVGFVAYAFGCVVTTAHSRLPVWLGAIICWAAWFLVAAVAWATVRPS